MDYGRSGSMGGIAWPRLTPAVKALMIVNGVVFLLNALLHGTLSSPGGLNLGVWWGGLWQGYGLGLVRLITTQFVHSFLDPFHILFNMLGLYFFGTFVEEAIGKERLLKLYLTAGVVGAVGHVALQALLGADIPAVGASGAIYGILVYAACMAPRMKVIFIVFPIELRWLVGGLVGIGVYMSYIQLVTASTDGVAHGGHLGGALWGFLAYRLPQRHTPGLLDRFRQWQARRDHRSRAERQQVLDQLLDKVHREGLGSLTAAEQRFLRRTSEDMRRK